MKLNNNYIVYQADSGTVLVSVGGTAFSGVVHLNKTAEYIIRCLEAETDRSGLISLVTEKYSVDKETAANDIDSLLDKLRKIGAIDG